VYSNSKPKIRITGKESVTSIGCQHIPKPKSSLNKQEVIAILKAGFLEGGRVWSKRQKPIQEILTR